MMWRTLGDVPLSFWRQKLENARSPLGAEAEATWLAARPHSALALAMLWVESQFGTAFRRNSVGNRNALNLRPRGGDGFLAFGTWAEGVAEWRARVTDPAYAYRDTGTVAELVAVFAPGWDANDPARYAKTVETLVAGWPREAGVEKAQGSTRPVIVLTAGHRSDNDTGNPEEKKRTPLLAQAYQQAFEAAGFVVNYWQSIDGDDRPDQSPGGLDGVGRGVGRLMAGIPGASVLLDLHFEGGGPRGAFAIVPDVTGLTTAVPNGAPTDDTWAKNGDDVALARLVAKAITGATGLPLRATTEPGVMSERATGVGTQGWRLAMFAYTAGNRARSPRLVIEHGCLTQAADRAIIDGPGFYEKCALAAVNAVRAAYGLAGDPPKPPTIYAEPGARPTEWDGTDKTINGNVFHAFERRVQMKAGARFRQFAGTGSADTRAPAKAGESVRVQWAVRGDGGWWWVTDAGHRVLQRDTDCQITVTSV